MSQRILSSSSLPLRQRSDKPPWCECAPFLIRGECDDEGGREVKCAKRWKPSIGGLGSYALPFKEQKQKGEIGKKESSHMPCEKAAKERASL